MQSHTCAQSWSKNTIWRVRTHPAESKRPAVTSRCVTVAAACVSQAHRAPSSKHSVLASRDWNPGSETSGNLSDLFSLSESTSCRVEPPLTPPPHGWPGSSPLWKPFVFSDLEPYISE